MRGLSSLLFASQPPQPKSMLRYAFGHPLLEKRRGVCDALTFVNIKKGLCITNRLPTLLSVFLFERNYRLIVKAFLLLLR